MADKEQWSWIKFIKGFFDGKNYAKAIVFLFCSIVIISIIGALTFTVTQVRGCGRQDTETKIGTNTGTVNQTDSHSNTQVTNHYYPLSDVLSWVFGNKQRVEKTKE